MGNCWWTVKQISSISSPASDSSKRRRRQQASCVSASSSSSTSTMMSSVARSDGDILQSANVWSFTFNDLRTSTRNFRPDSVLGEGGFGSVFKGWIFLSFFPALFSLVSFLFFCCCSYIMY